MEKDPINNLDSDSTPKPTPKKTRKRKVVIVGEDSLKSLIEPKVSSEDVVVCVPNSDIDKESVELSVENVLSREIKTKIKKELESKITIQPTVKPDLSKLEEVQLYFRDLAKRIELNRSKRYDEELWNYLEKNRRTIGEECALIEAGKSALCKRLRDYALTKYEKLK